LAGLGVILGDSISLKWTVKAYQEGHDSLTASLPFNIKFVRLIKTPTSVEALGLENNIKIYPNPVIDFINLTNTTGKNLDIQVIDLKGQILYEGNVSEMAKIDLNHLTSGLYILRVQTVNQDPLRYLFIKSN
jgi:hypothetical protein